MLEKVKFTKEASDEFMESVKWYESAARGLGLGFTDEIGSTIERIKRNPDLYGRITGNIRRIQVNRFRILCFT
uniref:ParE toxin of type II toxin-antitoxin system, parDE n=1 Tax=Candidatus Kentrum sp. UNK TaxID=2126344 RepID=A0A451ATK0_9GAMM|nr:MAG: hypothetical protein BECKUNK1418G_GA0071005_107827 [Candidatus Kentron sp. UNK]VFK69369.1 MAG: hypothetical protein BECKUNK1418H_GA0071006_10132 [Candidatus Kentron sp. UNK]